jgi:hypothetical protein
LIDRAFGLLWAVALLAPGWNSLEPLVFLNPNAVATALLGTLAITLHGWNRPSLHRFFMMGVWLGFAAHVHPTAAPAAVLAIPLLRQCGRSGVSVPKAVVTLMAGFSVLFIPYGISQSINGFADWGAVSGYMEHQVSLGGVLATPTIVWHCATGGMELLLQYFFDLSPGTAAFGGFAAAIAYATSTIVALRSRDAAIRRCARAALVALVVIAAWVGMMRTTTPFQFTWVLAPLLAALLALGLRSVLSLRAGATSVAAACATLAAMGIASGALMAGKTSGGEGTLPATVLDIKGSLGTLEFHDVWFPAHGHAQLGEALCGAERNIGLHGHLGYVVDKDLALDMLLACGRRTGVELGGLRSDGWVGMTGPFWAALGESPDCWIGSLGISRAIRFPHPQAAIALAGGDKYLPRTPSGAVPRLRTLSFPYASERAILATNVLGGYEYFRVASVRLRGTEVNAAAANDLSALYVAPASTPPGSMWDIAIEASLPEAIDVVALIARSSEEGRRGCR